MKSLLRKVIPDSIRRIVRANRTQQIQREYQALSMADTFDRVYAARAWGGNGSESDGRPNSGLGSTAQFVTEYCKIIEGTLRDCEAKTVADLGCGNFNTGSIIAGMVEAYIGVDVARAVIDNNRRLFGDKKIQFAQADLTCDPLPRADVAILRQVLQHLTNQEIKAVLENVLGTYAIAIVTEHVYTGLDGKANKDIGHGPGTRVPIKSGVFVDQSPFSIPTKELGDIQYGPNEVLRTWLIKANSNQK